MILHVPPGSPLLVRAAADAILALHVGGGVVGVLSGGVALAARKARRLHRIAGRVFFVAMLTMSAIGTIVSPFLPNWSNVVMGLFVFYLVGTAWMAARRPPGPVGAFETGAFVFACAAAATGVLLGLVAAASPTGSLDGDPPAGFFVLAGFPALAGALDLGVILRREISGARRVARHLWRMSVALFIAAGSLFLGQPRLFPPGLRGSPIMFLPEIAILALMIFWLFRLRSTRNGNAGAHMAHGLPSV